MATDPLAQPSHPAILPAAKIPLLLRVLADPAGKGTIAADQAASIEQIEKNLARHRNVG